MEAATDPSVNDKKVTIDSLVREIKRERSNHPATGDRVAALLGALGMLGPRRAEILNQTLRGFLADPIVEVRMYAAIRLEALDPSQ
jgi:hypothetical protein